MMNTCSNTNADSDKIQKLKRLVEKMNQIAYVDAYGWQNKKITRALGLKHNDDFFDTIYRKYTYYCLQAAQILIDFRCFHGGFGHYVLVDTEVLRNCLEQIPSLEPKYLMFHTTASDITYDDSNYCYRVTGVSIPSHGPEHGIHDDTAFSITIPYEIGMHLPDNSKLHRSIVRSVVGKGRWKL